MRPTHRPHRRAAAALALLCAAALTACGDEPSGGSEGSDGVLGQRTGFAAVLESQPGVVSAEAEEEIVEGEGIEQLDVHLVVADDATQPQIAAVLDLVAAHDRELGFDQHHSLVLERDGREPHPTYGAHTLQYSHELLEPTAELVRRWALAEERLDAALAWHVDGYGAVTVELDEQAVADDVTALAEEVAAEPDLAALPYWTLVAEGEDARAYFAVENGMTDAVLGSWRTAVANLALGPPGASITLAPQNSPESYEADPPPAGSMRLDVGLELPGVHTPAQLTPERWGDRLWPLLRAQLDVVRELPPSSHFAADHFYTEADGTGGGLDQFLYVTAGERPSREEPDRGWNVAAARYLAGGG